MKVCVFDDKTGKPLGIGDFCRTEDIRVAADEYGEGRVVCTIKNNPVIVMEEDGEIVYGIECWWYPV